MSSSLLRVMHGMLRYSSSMPPQVPILNWMNEWMGGNEAPRDAFRRSDIDNNEAFWCAELLKQMITFPSFSSRRTAFTCECVYAYEHSLCLSNALVITGNWISVWFEKSISKKKKLFWKPVIRLRFVTSGKYFFFSRLQGKCESCLNDNYYDIKRNVS